MYKWLLMVWALLVFPLFNAEAQNTSNKGKEFWITYTGHIDSLESRMYLYITSDVNTTVEVKVAGVNIPNSPFSITANTVKAVPINPKVIDVYIGTSDVIEPARKSIQVVAEKPVIVYSHIFRSARSAATLVLPTTVLGREYYATAYKQNKPGGDNPGKAYSQFTIIGVENNTTVEITPKAADIGKHHAAGETFQKILQKGEIYQYQSETDLSASHIISVAGANETCKPIAVFSGSTWVGFCGDDIASTNGGDNLYQQLYPITAWGKEFITAPFINKPHDVFRVYFSKDSTTLTINGAAVAPSGFNKGSFYEFKSSVGNRIVASQPISLVQYQISQGCDSENRGLANNAPAPHPGDPEMTILNPVEQTLSKITVYSALRNQTNPPTAIVQHYINVIIKDEFKASFTINGLAPQAAFKSIANTGYSYLQENVTLRSAANPTHTLVADGGFSAIAYGYGNVESYGYLAGADARNLYQNLQISDASTHLETTDVCSGQTAAFTLALPYPTNKLTWSFDDEVQTPLLNPEYTTDVVNNITVYKYIYYKNITFDSAGVHQIKVIYENLYPTGCDINEEIVLDFEVFDKPVAEFSVSTQQGCAGVPIIITDKSRPNGKNMAKWHWDFGDGTVPVTLRSGAPFEHVYENGGDYEIKLWVESETGCSSMVTDPIRIHINKLPEAKFDFSKPSCETRSVTFTDASTATEGTITKWQWKFDDANATASNPNVSADRHPVHTFSRPGTYNVSLVVETDKGCSNIAYVIPVVISELPLLAFEMPDACVNESVLFKNTSTNKDATTTSLTYLWEFNDPASGALNTSTDQHGQHKFTAPGDYQVKLTVKNQGDCSQTIIQTFKVNGAVPKALFEVLAKDNLCSNKELLIKDLSTLDFGNITKLVWYFDGEKVGENLHPTVHDTYTFNYPPFSVPAQKPLKIKLIAFSGSDNGGCGSIKEEIVEIKAFPSIKFEALMPRCINAGKIQIEASESNNQNGTGTFSGRGITSAGLFDPAVAGAGTWEITYTFVTDGCKDEKKQNIVVNPIPKVSIASDLYGYVDGTIEVNASVTERGLKYKWSPAEGLSNPNVLNPVITADKDRVYKLVVTSPFSCEETVIVNVHVLRNIEPANAFSPNGDGVNDVWKINYIETYRNSTVEVFNRYGEKVFFSEGYSIPFDGNYKGNPLPVGTYYYMINPKNGKKTITGPLTLIR